MMRPRWRRQDLLSLTVTVVLVVSSLGAQSSKAGTEQELRDLNAVVETVKRDHEDERQQINALTSQMGSLRKPAPAPVVAAAPPAPGRSPQPAAAATHIRPPSGHRTTPQDAAPAAAAVA